MLQNVFHKLEIQDKFCSWSFTEPVSLTPRCAALHNLRFLTSGPSLEKVAHPCPKPCKRTLL